MSSSEAFALGLIIGSIMTFAIFAGVSDKWLSPTMMGGEVLYSGYRYLDSDSKSRYFKVQEVHVIGFDYAGKYKK